MLDKFRFGLVQKVEFNCLGWSLKQYKDNLMIDQFVYVDVKIKHPDINAADRPNDKMLNPSEITTMRDSCGQFCWLTDHSHGDLGDDKLELSMKVAKATIKDVKLVRKMVNCVKSTPIKLKFIKIDWDEWYISVFSDAGGHVSGEVKNANPIYWRSAKIPRMVS